MLVYQAAECVCVVFVYTVCAGVSAVEMKAGEKMEEKYSFSSVSHNPALCCRPLPSPSLSVSLCSLLSVSSR